MSDKTSTAYETAKEIRAAVTDQQEAAKAAAAAAVRLEAAKDGRS